MGVLLGQLGRGARRREAAEVRGVLAVDAGALHRRLDECAPIARSELRFGQTTRLITVRHIALLAPASAAAVQSVDDLLVGLRNVCEGAICMANVALQPDVIVMAASSRSGCQSCRQPIARGELRFGQRYMAVHGEAHRWYHLACAAKSQPERLRAVLAKFPAEIPGLEAVLKGTKVVRVLPQRPSAAGTVPRTGDEALAAWRATATLSLSPNLPVKTLLERLQEPLLAPRAWHERYKAWQSAVSSGDPVLLACALRSLNPYRDEHGGRGLSYGESLLFDEARSRLAAQLGAVYAEEIDSMLSAITNALDAGMNNEDA